MCFYSLFFLLFIRVDHRPGRETAHQVEGRPLPPGEAADRLGTGEVPIVELMSE